MPLESRLRQPAALIKDSARIVVGYSGGLDSTVLLHCLQRAYGPRVHALHVHHGLQADADAWADHCRQVCASWGVPLAVVPVDVRADGQGLEAAARAARLAAFDEQLVAGDVLALAHHQDDQAETFLLHALRGSGVEGLAAMRAWQARGVWHVWRPLLEISRYDIEAHARLHGLRWIEDPSNAGTQFDRNYLRLEVMPKLKARWPHAAEAFGRAAKLQADLRDETHAETLHRLEVCRHDAQDLKVDVLMRFSHTERAKILREWVNELGLPPLGQAHLEHIERDLLAARHDADPVFVWQDARIQRWRDVLHASMVHAAADFEPKAWNGLDLLTLPDGRCWQVSPPMPFPQPYRLVQRHGGERIQLPGRRHRTEVKKLLQAMGVPTWARESLPLLVDELGEVHAIPSLAVSAELSAWLTSTGARLTVTPCIDPIRQD